MDCADGLTAKYTESEWIAIEEENDNMLIKLQRPRLEREFLDYLENCRPAIQSLVSNHLSLSPHQHCTVSDRSQWMHGDFNVCIPISISQWKRQRLLMRCPFPHMVGLRANSAGLDEKVRCEAATFAWISQNCPKVPIPRLWGFGVPSGLNVSKTAMSLEPLLIVLQFTPVANLPWYIRWFLGQKSQRSKHFFPRRSLSSLKSGYLLVDFIEAEQGTRLSKMWPPRTDEQRRTFYSSLSTIMLDLASQPLQKIGSFTVDDSGVVTLSNRPLTSQLVLHESQGIPTEIPRHRCYQTTDAYIRDLLRCHDLKLMHQPNAVDNKNDAEAQMALLTTMRAISSHFTLESLREGPFGYIWTDDHQSNIFVDSQYKVTYLPDLEWFCSMPLDMQRPPFWLSGYEVDEVEDRNRDVYDTMCEEFLSVFEREDSRPSLLGSGFLTKVMRDAHKRNAHWFWASLHHPRVTYNLFLDHLQPRLAPYHLERMQAIQFQETLAPYWIENAPAFIDQKLHDREKYLEQLNLAHRR